MSETRSLRNLVLVLGDQLNEDSAAFDGFDPSQDAVWMAEVSDESTHVWSHKIRTALFLSAMRHFRDALTEGGKTVYYRLLEDQPQVTSFGQALQGSLSELQPQRMIVVLPGEHRVLLELESAAETASVPLEVRPDRSFFSTPEEFAKHAKGRKQLRLEYFYRELRRRFDILMDGDQPEGGQWNYDAENRGSFKKAGPGEIPPPVSFAPDRLTRDVIEVVESQFSDHPGNLANFDWPVTSEQANKALQDFITHRLSSFGQFQDAMWTSEPYLFHSRLSAAMNLKLLAPRVVIEASIDAYRRGDVPLNSAEGFVRQILGWREYVRGVYYLYMPEYLHRNELNATEDLPDFFWTGDTEMHCLSQAIGQTLEYGYAHHIQRLMVTGLFCLLVGVDPQQTHEWYLAVYVDAVEWVELPNTLGMSQFADGGVMASKPYVATGKYIKRMSNYCSDCRYNPDVAVGEEACPFTTLYWDFLQRHRQTLKKNNRMALQLKNLERKDKSELVEITSRANELREDLKTG